MDRSTNRTILQMQSEAYERGVADMLAAFLGGNEPRGNPYQEQPNKPMGYRDTMNQQLLEDVLGYDLDEAGDRLCELDSIELADLVEYLIELGGYRG